MSDEQVSYVTFEVDDLLLGVDIDRVQEIHRGAEVTTSRASRARSAD